MFVILAYDVNEKRVAKVLKVARKYLVWVQNSLLHGNITKAKFDMLKMELRQVIEKEDKVRFYITSTQKYLKVVDLYDNPLDSRDDFIV